MSDRPTVTSGEKRGYRGAIDRMTKQLVESGMKPSTAQDKARKAAQASDRAGDKSRD
jgi:hypothetical protein